MLRAGSAACVIDRRPTLRRSTVTVGAVLEVMLLDSWASAAHTHALHPSNETTTRFTIVGCRIYRGYLFDVKNPYLALRVRDEVFPAASQPCYFLTIASEKRVLRRFKVDMSTRDVTGEVGSDAVFACEVTVDIEVYDQEGHFVDAKQFGPSMGVGFTLADHAFYAHSAEQAALETLEADVARYLVEQLCFDARAG